MGLDSALVEKESALASEVATVAAEIQQLDKQINAELALERKEEAQLYKLDMEYNAALKAGNMDKANSLRAEATLVKSQEDANKALRRRLVAEDQADLALLQK